MESYDLDLGKHDNIVDVGRWTNIYEGNPPWLYDDEEASSVPSNIVSSIAKKATIEMESRIVGKDGEANNEKAAFLDKQYQRLIDKSRVNVEHLLVQGGAVLRPYVSNGNIVTEFILPNRFIPVRFNESGDLVEVIFIDRLEKGNKTFTKLETHVLKDNGDYSIIHTFHLGEGITSDGKVSKEISSDLVPAEWADADFEKEFYGTGFEFPLFVYMRNPAANNKDINSPLGVSIYSKVEGNLKAYDSIYNKYLWEFEGGELALITSRDFIREMDPSFGNSGRGTFDGLGERQKGKMKRLVTTLDSNPKDLNDPITVFSPDLREEGFNAGMEKILRDIEFGVGLGYGELSRVDSTEKTAEEIRAGKQRTHTTLVDIQKEIERVYTKVVKIMEKYLDLGEGYHKLVSEGAIDDEIELTWTFDDSIVVDRKSMLDSMLEDVKLGIIPKERYIMEKYGFSEEEAKRMAMNNINE